METTQEITKFVPILSIVESYQAARRETEEAFQHIQNAETHLRGIFGPTAGPDWRDIEYLHELAHAKRELVNRLAALICKYQLAVTQEDGIDVWRLI